MGEETRPWIMPGRSCSSPGSPISRPLACVKTRNNEFCLCQLQNGKKVFREETLESIKSCVSKCLVGAFTRHLDVVGLKRIGKTSQAHNLTLLQELKDMIEPPDEILQHGALPCALAADHRYLRQIQVATLADGAEGVLELVDEGNEVFHSPIPHVGRLVHPAGSMLLFKAVR